MRRVQAGAPNVQPKDDGLAPMATPDAGRIGVPVYPGATFLPFASDPGSGRHAFSTDASPQEVADFYANAASGRKAVGVEEFSRLYFRASADDPTGAKAVMADQGAWFKRVIESGRQPVEADMERQQQAMLNLPGLRYSDATLSGSPVFVASTLDSSGGVARATRYVAISRISDSAEPGSRSTRTTRSRRDEDPPRHRPDAAGGLSIQSCPEGQKRYTASFKTGGGGGKSKDVRLNI